MIPNIYDKLSIYYILTLIIGVITPIIPLLLLIGLFIFIDLFLGIWKSVKLKKRITSKGLFQTVAKMFQYQMVIITIFLLDKFLVNEFVNLFITLDLFITKVVAVTLISTELLSINENLEFIFKINIIERLKNTLMNFFKIKKLFDKYQ